MKDRICNWIIFAAMLFMIGAGVREMLIHNGRLTTDLNADGHSITNLPDGFFPPSGVTSVNGQTGDVVVAEADLTPSTNYTDRALGAFAETGTVARARSYGTATRWTDATGCVWEVTPGWRIYTNGVVAAGWTAWNYHDDSVEDGIFWSLMIGLDEDAGSLAYTIVNQILPSGTTPKWDSELTIVYNGDADYHGIMPGDAIRAVRGETNLVGRVALMNDLPDVSGYATQQQATNAATAVADTKISTNNAAFVAAVTNCPVVIASGGGGGGGFPAGDWSDYGTLGALLAAIIAAITWLKNNQRYALHTVTLTNGAGTLLARAVNAVSVTGATTLTLPALENVGKARDFLVKVTTSADDLNITWQGQGSEAPNGADELQFVTEDGDFPVVGTAGDYLFSFTEIEAHTFAVSMKPIVAAPQAQGGS